MKLRLCGLTSLLVVLSSLLHAYPAQQPAPPSIPSVMDEAVAAYRKIIVLMDHADALDEGNHQRVRTAAWMLFEENHERLEKLDSRLRSDLARNDPNSTNIFLMQLESPSAYRDADKLVFRDLLDGLATLAPPQIPSTQLADDVAALNKIQTLYEKEVSQIFGDIQTRAMPVHREAWERYVAFLRTKYQREQILKEYDSQLPPAEARGGAARRSTLETFGTELPPNTYVFTFDDGPHPRYTDQAFAVLKNFGLRGVFFEVGKNLGTVNDKNEVTVPSLPLATASCNSVQPSPIIATAIRCFRSSANRRTQKKSIPPTRCSRILRKRTRFCFVLLTASPTTPFSTKFRPTICGRSSGISIPKIGLIRFRRRSPIAYLPKRISRSTASSSSTTFTKLASRLCPPSSPRCSPKAPSSPTGMAPRLLCPVRRAASNLRPLPLLLRRRCRRITTVGQRLLASTITPTGKSSATRRTTRKA